VRPAWLIAPACLLLVACRAGSGAAYARRGPHAAGTREVLLRGGGQTPSLALTFWYPAVAQGPAEVIYQGATEGIGPAGQSGPVRGRAQADAPLAPSAGRLPLVVFLPEKGKGRMLYAMLLEHWASHGLAVLACNPGRTPEESADRILRILAGVGTLPVDARHIVLAGHGEGARAALLAAGRTTPDGVLLLGPARPILPAGTGPPVLLVAGEGPWPETTLLALLPGAGPDLYGIAPGELATSMDMAPLDTGTWSLRRARGVIHPLTTAFLLATLRADPQARRALLPGGMDLPGVRYTTAWR
jgi:hypothetical protein